MEDIVTGTAILIFLVVGAVVGAIWSLALYVGDESDIAPKPRVDPLGKQKRPSAQNSSDEKY